MLGYCAVHNVFLSTGLFLQKLCRMCKCAYVAVLIRNCSHNKAAGVEGSALLFWVSGGWVGVQAVCCLRGILKWKILNGEPTVRVFSRFQLGDSGVTLPQYFSLWLGPSCCRHRVQWSWVGLGAVKGPLQRPQSCSSGGPSGEFRALCACWALSWSIGIRLPGQPFSVGLQEIFVPHAKQVIKSGTWKAGVCRIAVTEQADVLENPCEGLSNYPSPRLVFMSVVHTFRSLSKFSFVWRNSDYFLFFRRWLFIDTARNIYG